MQLPSSPRGYCILCKTDLHLNWSHTVLHLNLPHIPKNPSRKTWIFLSKPQAWHIITARSTAYIITRVACIPLRLDDIHAFGVMGTRICGAFRVFRVCRQIQTIENQPLTCRRQRKSLLPGYYFILSKSTPFLFVLLFFKFYLL